MKNKGFTLIELMIVVAIIGILAMIAMPSYQDYTKRTYVAEGLNLANGVKTSIMEQFATSASYDNVIQIQPQGTAIKGQAVDAIWADTGLATGNIPIAWIYIFFNEKVVQNPSQIHQAKPDFAQTFSSNNFLMLNNDRSTAGSTIWRCVFVGRGLLHRWLPASCRSQLGA